MASGRFAECLAVPAERLMAAPDSKTAPAGVSEGAVLISQKVIDMFPDLGNYLEMLEKAGGIEDTELIEYLAGKIGDIMRNGPAADSAAHPTITSGTEGG